MRRVLIPAALAGAALLAIGVCWGYAVRRELTSGGATAALLLGTVLCSGALAGAIVLERRAAGLEVPAGCALPGPHWAGPVGLVAVCDGGGGSYASPLLAVLGAVLGAAAAVGYGLELSRPPLEIDRGSVVTARRLLAFARAHVVGVDGGDGGDDVVGVSGSGVVGVDGAAGAQLAVQPLGRGLWRLLVVGGDGAYGDAVVRGARRARQAADLSGLRVGDAAERELASRIRTGRFEWRRMAGSQLGGRDAAAGR